MNLTSVMLGRQFAKLKRYCRENKEEIIPLVLKIAAVLLLGLFGWLIYSLLTFLLPFKVAIIVRKSSKSIWLGKPHKIKIHLRIMILMNPLLRYLSSLFSEWFSNWLHACLSQDQLGFGEEMLKIFIKSNSLRRNVGSEEKGWIEKIVLDIWEIGQCWML